jgi:alpha-D-xyloside xylohydrolase
MKKHFYALIMMMFGVSFLTQAQSKVKLIYSGNQKNVSFELSSRMFTSPLSISNKEADQKGNIFFETVSGKTFLKGEPANTKISGDKFLAEWKVENRIVSVAISSKQKDFEIKFAASPDKDILKWGFNIKSDTNEYLTGLYEHVVDGNQKNSWATGIKEGMNLRGQTVEMLINPTLSIYCPFYISSKGYGLFVKGTWPGHYDLCKEFSNVIQISFEGPSLEFSIYTDKNPAELVKKNAMKLGPPILPPKWAFLPIRWRDEHLNLKKYYDNTDVTTPYNSQLVEDILMMKAFDIPCGSYWIDRPWGPGKVGYDDFKWDENRIPKAKDMIKWLGKKNINFLLWIAPWVSGNMAVEAKQKKYSIQSNFGKSYDTTLVASIDFTNPKAVKWWQEEGLAKIIKDGVKGFKLDRAEEELVEPRDKFVSNGKSMRENRNDYPVQYLKATNEVCRKYLGNDFLLFPRAAYSGSTKYGSFWGGDIAEHPEGLRCAIIAQQRSAILGYPVWGSDIGGYWQGNFSHELCARWLGFGCFSPMMEVGPTRNRGVWNWESESSYDAELMATWRFYTKLHAQLQNYSYTLAKDANKTGMPIVRPLFLTYPDQKEAYNDWQTFLYGPDILVSAIWEMGVTMHELYLPKGEKWICAWQPEKVYEGGTKITVDAPIYKIPIFIRKGSKINLGDLNKLYAESVEKTKVKPNLSKLEKEEKW